MHRLGRSQNKQKRKMEKTLDHIVNKNSNVLEKSLELKENEHGERSNKNDRIDQKSQLIK